MIHPSRRSRSELSLEVEPSQVDLSREAAGARGRRLREWPVRIGRIWGGVVPSTCNYRKLASFCRFLPTVSFIPPRLTLSARASFITPRGITRTRFADTVYKRASQSAESDVERGRRNRKFVKLYAARVCSFSVIQSRAASFATPWPWSVGDSLHRKASRSHVSTIERYVGLQRCTWYVSQRVRPRSLKRHSHGARLTREKVLYSSSRGIFRIDIRFLYSSPPTSDDSIHRLR